MEFNDIKTTGKLYFTITNESETKNGIQLKDGLNIIETSEEIPLEFDCGYKPVVPNLLYFNEPDDICEYMAYGVYLREVYLPDDPKLRITKMYNFPCGKSMMYGANMIILGKRYSLSDPKTYEYIKNCGGDLRCDGDNALLVAAENGYLEVVKYLINQGLDVRSDFDYALRSAAEKGHIDVVKILLENGADISSHNHWPLKFAALEGQFEMVKYLISKGADVRADNYKAIKFAHDNNHDEIVDYLLDLCPELHINDTKENEDNQLENKKKLENRKFIKNHHGYQTHFEMDKEFDDIKLKKIFDKLDNIVLNQAKKFFIDKNIKHSSINTYKPIFC
ncbi:ankyrin repeat protein [Acanthamoeba polyphaga moumouvirus]|uniref:Ankyrin repeat protein n=1 Tax=Acanthamoeba polyphaga moumouvirus TaxID=1269028 RepID=L7RE56_9VIRU|nr:ankyrin repeat protein [Acanthamoeba polyphaga moumouvirus]AGC02418.1 ankyrin repeat protein [Acanthamoeba polyphaga moumouvirus]